MKIKINDLGPVGEGTVDLAKPINLFCGPNGTGKTYFAYAIYGFLRGRIHIPGDEQVVNGLINDGQVAMPIDFDRLAGLRDQMAQSVSKNASTIFGIGDAQAAKLFGTTKVEFADTLNDRRREVTDATIDTTIAVAGVPVLMLKAAGDDAVTLKLTAPLDDDAIGTLRLRLFTYVYHALATFPVTGVAVFPVERNSIYTFSNELSVRRQEAVDNFQRMMGDRSVSKFELFFNANNRYSLPIKDSLGIADDLAEVRKASSTFNAFAGRIEKELLGGQVMITKDGDIAFRPTGVASTQLPIQVSASMVKTLASVVVYLKHLARPGDLLIIDEPELNLHPDSQVLLARLLARLANAGFRLLVSTHSDYIIREFNCMIMASCAESESVKRAVEALGYADDERIDHSDLAVHRFARRTKRGKVTLKPVEIDEYGFAIDTIDATIRRQNEAQEQLYYAIKYGDEAEAE